MSFFEDPLVSEYQTTFTTPTIRVTNTYPGNNILRARDATMWVCFDQIIDPEAVLNFITVSTSRWGSSHSPLRILSEKVTVFFKLCAFLNLLFYIGS